jgi:DNA-binding beta-propeller fold protein YncE
VIRPDGSKIVQTMGNLAQINIIDTNTGQVIGYRMKNTPGFSFFETRMDSRKTYFIRVQANNNYIYTSYWGKQPWGLKEVPDINTIYVFDWNGKLLYKIVVDQTVHEFWLDEVRNRLYITNESVDDVFYLDLNDIKLN